MLNPARHPFTTVAFLTVAWTAYTAVHIAALGQPGADSAERLAISFQEVVQTRDVSEAQRLIIDPPDDDAVEALLARARCGAEPNVLATGAGKVRYLQVSSAGGGVCGILPAAEHGGRWYIDLWADPLGTNQLR